MRRSLQSVLVVVTLIGSLLASMATASAAPPAGASRFVKVDPTRVLDTRSGIGAPAGIVAPGGSLDLATTWAAPVPATDVTAVVLNVTAVDATGPGFVQVYPTGSNLQGKSSNLNVEAAGQTIPNLVVVPVGTDGRVTLYTQGGGHLVADVFGFFVAATNATDGRYKPMTPSRLLDTRQLSTGRLPADSSVKVPVAGQGGVPASGVGAVVLNVTADNATNPGFVQVIPTNGSTAIGTSSNLNVVRAGQTMPNLVIVPVGTDGSVTVYSQSGTHLVVDVLGYFTDSSVAAGEDGLFVPVTPDRMLDTRGAAKPAAGSHTALDPRGRSGVPSSGVAAILGNLTATQASVGWVQVLPGGSPTTAVGAYSNVNVDHEDQTIPNATVANLGGDGKVDLYTSSSSHLLFDVAGYFTTAPAPIAPAALSVTITSPTGVATGNQTVTATTTGAGVLGVQFKVNGVDLGSEDNVAPYTAQWVTADAPNGTYTLTAVVRRAGETLTSQPQTVMVSNAMLTLTFDDGWASQLPAAQALRDNGLHASFFPLSMSLAEQYPDPYMSTAELLQIKNMGHEIGSHTVDHKDLTTLTTEQALAELADSKAALEAAGLGPITNFVSPYGSTNPAILDQIKSLYGSHRGVDQGLDHQGINYPADHRSYTIEPGYTGFDFDRYDLKVANVYGSNADPEQGHVLTTADDIDLWLNQLKAGQVAYHTPQYRNNAWMILVFHEVAENPRGGLPTDTDVVRNEYNVKPAVFADMVQRIKASGVRVLTMQQALVETGAVAG